MLAVHLIAATLVAVGPAVGPAAAPATVPPAAIEAVPTAAPAVDQESPPDPAAPVVEKSDTAPAVEQSPAPAENFEIEPDLAGLEHDPLEGFNRISFGFSQIVDKIVIRPAAMVYRHVVPKPGRDGVHNVLSNLNEPLVFVNDLLQLRPDRMIRTLGRFLINSTLGLGGLFDIAKRKPYNLPHHANSFGDTLGYYGVKPGPYIYVPIFGPTTLRDAIGSAEGLLPPMVIGSPFDREDYQLSTNIADGLDQRERNDDDLKAMLRDAIDPYATFRANFLQNRAGEISSLKAHEGASQASPAADDPLADPLTDPAPPQPAPTTDRVPESEPAPPGQ
jgi:phospholipid-binding lipoprotein MlaA